MNGSISLIGKPLSHVAGASIQSFFLYFPIVHFATEEVRKFFLTRPKLLKLLSMGTFFVQVKRGAKIQKDYVTRCIEQLFRAGGQLIIFS